jgi:hypothetical protein
MNLSRVFFDILALSGFLISIQACQIKKKVARCTNSAPMKHLESTSPDPIVQIVEYEEYNSVLNATLLQRIFPNVRVSTFLNLIFIIKYETLYFYIHIF